ncbi:MAG: hypothetical protein LAT67_06140 [Balneolales bacterium]|nr:hypothetical protein [Balneolales bacterium]
MWKSFFISLALINAVLLVAAWLFEIYTQHNVFPGFVLALIITSANAVAALKFAADGIHAGNNAFMIRVMGGMGLRLLIMLIAVMIVVFFTNLPTLSFTISLFISYISKSVLEIIFVLKIKDKNPQPFSND